MRVASLSVIGRQLPAESRGIVCLRVQAKARNWCVPTLLLWAGEDKLVNPAGSAAFAAQAPRDLVQSQCFETAYHEIFNESPELAEPVRERLQHWLAAHG